MKRAAAWASLCAMFIVLAESLFVARHIAYPGGDELPTGPSSQSMDAMAVPRNSEVARVLKDTGANLPPVGRSLFDRLVMDKTATGGWDIPFPFPKLLSELSVRAGCGNKDSGCYKTVLIPLGRSLQRTAAAPEFFKYPRMVVAFNADPSRLTKDFFPLLKDRLYLGYQERANLIEVISYNEEASRFEFQLVKDYQANAEPRVFYANRAICVSCHQNQAPIFSRQVWDETNANPEIARRLKSAREDFLGLPITIGVDVPNAIDDATDRANLLAAYHSLWRDGCGERIPDVRMCRAQALRASLQYRLTGERSFDQRSPAFTHGFLAPLQKNWQLHWPDGIKIPNNDIPNRDPLQFAESERLAHVPARFEPLLSRGHKEVWQFETDRYRLIKGIGEFFSDADIQLFADKLKLVGKRDSADQDSFASPGYVALDNAIERMLDDPAGQAALDKPTIQREPLLRALLHALDATDVHPCCQQNSALSPALMDDDDTTNPGSPPVELAPFYAYCARCHATKEPFPPNFMQGSPTRVEGELKRCADRIYFRLAMWDVAPEQRPKTPMPPATGLNLHDGRWTASAAITSMRAYLAPFVHNDLRQAPEKLVSRSYEALPSCALH
jgi:hypothetical protein